MDSSVAQGRLKGRKPVAVIDIGSNSVRLVVYEGLVRSPTVLFNEKILCGLGKGVAKTGCLEPDSVEMALRTLRRFHAICEQIGVSAIHTLATAAAREAKNGPAFISEAEKILNAEVKVLTGKEEATYSAYGIISTFHHPDGIAGDLGGGSLELVDIHETSVGDDGITLPLGGLRLQDMSDNNLAEATKIARRYLKSSEILSKNKGRNFYAVGGTWRNLAKLHIAVKHYPLPVMHGYEVEASDMESFLHRVAKGEIDQLKNISAISKNRRQLLSYGATVLTELMRCLNPKKIIFSGAGVREGFMFSELSPKTRLEDPLIAACQEMATLRARSPAQAYDLIGFTKNAFDIFGFQENEEQKRYREAACLLADIGWRFHPDYRGDQSANQVAFGPYPGITHLGRVYVALSVFYRNEGLFVDDDAPSIIKLANKEIVERARFLGGLMRVANLFSASTAGILPDLIWKTQDKSIVLTIPERHADLIAERPIGRLQQLAKVTNKDLRYLVV